MCFCLFCHLYQYASWKRRGRPILKSRCGLVCHVYMSLLSYMLVSFVICISVQLWSAEAGPYWSHGVVLFVIRIGLLFVTCVGLFCHAYRSLLSCYSRRRGLYWSHGVVFFVIFVGLFFVTCVGLFCHAYRSLLSCYWRRTGLYWSHGVVFFVIFVGLFLNMCWSLLSCV